VALFCGLDYGKAEQIFIWTLGPVGGILVILGYEPRTLHLHLRTHLPKTNAAEAAALDVYFN